MGLESALYEKRGLESALWMKIEIRLGSALFRIKGSKTFSKGRDIGLESALFKMIEDSKVYFKR